MSENGRSSLKFINGLKGLACLLIMAGHYIGFYKYAENFPSNIRALDIIKNSSTLSELCSESFWVVFFFVISGYLLSRSKVETLGELARKILIRFIRLGLPLLFSYIIIFFLLYKTVGFLNASTIGYLSNNWFQSYYTESFGFLDVLLSPIHVLITGSDFSMNPPFWCLSSMFWASVLIYFLSYLRKRVNSKSVQISIYLFAMLGSCYLDYHNGISLFSSVISACVVGAVFQILIDGNSEFESVRESKWGTAGLICFAILFALLGNDLHIPIAFAILLVVSGKCKTANTFLSTGVMQKLGGISWGVYSFHFPVFSSLGMLVFLQIVKNNSDRVVIGYVTAVLVSIGITLLLSVAYYYSFDKITEYVLKTFKNRKQKDIV